MKVRSNWWIISLAAILIHGSALATFHQMQIFQIIAGVNGDTSAQAIQLRMRGPDEFLVSQARLCAYDAAGQNRVILIDFITDLPMGNNNVLISTASFGNYVTTAFTPDFIMTNPIPVSYMAAGRITFEDDAGLVLWSVSFGGVGYTGSNSGDTVNDTNGDFGPPFSGPLPTADMQSLRFSGGANALSTQNADQYALSVTAATFTNNSGTVFSLGPVHPVASNNGPLCEGETLNLAATAVASATDYTWTAPDNSTYNDVQPNLTFASALTSHTGIWTVTATVSGNPTAAGATSVVVNAVPAAPTISSNTPVCEESMLLLMAENVTNGSFAWTGPAGFTSNLQNPSLSNVTSAQAGTYSATVTVDGCTSPVAMLTVVVTPRPAAPTASSNSPICEGETLNLMASTVSNATYSWTGPNGFVSSLQNPSVPLATPAASGDYVVTVTVDGCTSLAATTTVNVVAKVNFTVSSNSPVCEGDPINLLATPAADSYQWSGPDGFTSTVQNPSIDGATLGKSGTYTLIATVSGCAMPVAQTTVVVNTRPATPVASSNSPVLEGSALQLTATTISGATYSWTGPDGFTSTQQNPVINAASATSAGDYNVVVIANGCNSSTASASVQVTLVPPVLSSGPVAAPDPAVVGSPVQLSVVATGAQPLTIAWSFGDGTSGSGASVSHTFSPAGTYDVTVTVTDSRNLSTSGNLSLIVYPAQIGGGGSGSTRVDTDGDGFTDEVEIAVGTSATNIASTPFGGAPAGTPQALSLAKLGIKLNFSKGSSDGISASGILPVPEGFSVAGQQVVADIGGVIKAFTLSDKGASPKSTTGSFKISVKARKGVVAAQDAKWALKIAKSNLAAALLDEGLASDSDVKDKAVSVPVTILFNQKAFVVYQQQLYSAKAGKSGKTK